MITITTRKGNESFNNNILKAHNEYRSKHGAPSLVWSEKLERHAIKWADEIARRARMQHAELKDQGENIAAMRGKELTGEVATKMWYDEIKDYDFNNPRFNPMSGHFSQVVWAGSVEFAAAKATAANGMQFVVARYYPAGNLMRQFAGNVFPLIKQISSISKPAPKQTIAAPKQKTVTVRIRSGKAANVKRPKSLFTYSDQPQFSSDEDE